MQKIAVVEDNTVVSQMIAAILSREGFEVEVFTSGDEAVSSITRLMPDLVLCDLMLPGIDGFEVLRRLQCDPHSATIPVVMISAQGDAHCVRRGMNFGADDFLAKPFGPEELLDAVRSRLRRRSRQQSSVIEGQKMLEQRRIHEECFDSVTGLPKERLLLESLLADEAGRSGALLLCIQMHSPETTIGVFGINAYSEILGTLARRLQPCGRLFRGSGPAEFFAVAEGEVEVAFANSRLTLEQARLPIETAAGVVRPILSGGFVELPATLSAAAALEAARLAVLEVRDAGGNSVARYDPAAPHRRRQQLAIENDIGRAIEENRLQLVFQPQVKLDSLEVYGIEALTRWHSPDGNLIPAVQWVPVLESQRLMAELSDWVAATAAKLLSTRAWFWAKQMRVSLNLSATQLDDAALPDRLDSILRKNGLSMQQVEVEVTESAASREILRAQSLLEEMSARGASIALDDFGAGYSSLSYLNQLSVDTLKIDRAFTRALPGDPTQEAIVSSVARLARALGLRIVAEGIENQEQRHILAALGCDCGQGYLFGRPQGIESLDRVFAGSVE